MLCGIPSVTLEGTRSDWEDLLDRILKLASFGNEPAQWARLLIPILTRFVEAFDGKPDVPFWGRVVNIYNMGSGPTYLSGWITAFCAWGSEGKWMGGSLPTYSEPITIKASMERSISPKEGKRGENLIIDGQAYPTIDTDDVPVAYCDVPVRLDDNGAEFDTIMIAGHLASKVMGDGDTVRPAPGWFMFIKDTAMEERLQAELVVAKENFKKVDREKDYQAWRAAYSRYAEVAHKLGQEVE